MTEIIAAEFETLPAPMQELVRAQQLDATHTADEWLALLSPLVALDTKVDAALKESSSASTGGCLGLFLTLVLGGVVVGVTAGFSPPAAGALGIVMVILLVYFGVRTARGAGRTRTLKTFDVPTQPAATLRDVVQLLRDDFAEHPLHLAVDFRPCETPETLVYTSPEQQRPPWRKLTEQYYDRRWLLLEGRFADGARVHVQLFNRIRKRYGWKRGSSGKTKHKTKRAMWMGIEAVVEMPHKRYRAPAAGAGVTADGTKLAIKPSEKRTMFRVRRRKKTLSLDAALPGDAVVDAIAEAYRHCAPTESA